MKKNYFLRAAGALLLAGVLMLGGVSGTVARFTEGAKAPQYARVAAFRVLVDGKVLGEGDDIRVNLFSTLFSSVDGIDWDSGLSGVAQVNQWAYCEDCDGAYCPDAEPVIAPGNGGQFAVDVENLSEVPIMYYISIDGTTLENDDEIPVEFRLKDNGGPHAWTDWEDWEDWKDGSTGELYSDGRLEPGGKTGEEVLVQWRWKYERGDDPGDTKLGVVEQTLFSTGKDGQTLSVGIKAMAVQID